MSLRDSIRTALNQACDTGEAKRAATLRLILAALEDRAAAQAGDLAEQDDDDEAVLAILNTMVAQRQNSVAHYESNGQLDLVVREQGEVDVISEFLPRRLDAQELEQAVLNALRELDARGLKDIGRTMAHLKSRYPGRLDPVATAAAVRARLAGGRAGAG